MNAEPGAGGGTALETVNQEGSQSALSSSGVAPVPIADRIPEKYRVFGGDDGKAFDLERSAGKLADAYGHLEKRLGTGDLPPESADLYKLDFSNAGEGFNVEEFMTGEGTQSFLKAAHAKGMTNSQVQFAVEFAMNEFAPQLMNGAAAISHDECISSLKSTTWKSDAEYSQNMQAANRAFMSAPQELRDRLDKKFGNDPDFIQFAAQFGREMREDSSISDSAPAGGITQADVDKIMLSPEYKNERHPDHQRLSKLVSDWYAKKHPG